MNHSLAESAQRIQHHTAAIIHIEEEARRKALLPILLIGLHCLRAHTTFAMVDVTKRGQGRKGKTKSPTTELGVDSYESWLATTAPQLKKSTTYKYMTAVRGLGADAETTEEELEKIFHSYTKPTLSYFVNAATQPLLPAPVQPVHEQLEFDLLRTTLKGNRLQCEELIATKDRLKAYPDLHEAACTRIYKTLHELTGCHWQPSDTPAKYAHLDENNIEI